MMQVHNGFGRHACSLSEGQLMKTTKWTTISEIQNIIGVFFVKFSVSLAILRILAGTFKLLRRGLSLYMGFLALLMLGNILILALQCLPFKSVWNTETPARCLSPATVTRFWKALAGR